MVRAKKRISPGGTARILIAEDHALMRAGLRAILSRNSRWKVCGEGVNGKEAVEKVQELRPDLAVLGISMPMMNGIEAAREIRRIAPATKILFLTEQEPSQIEDAVRQAGTDAIVKKTVTATSFTKAVKRLLDRHCRY